MEEELEETHNENSSINQGEACSNCNKSTNEIRQYLSIIQRLTEDKLSLEKSLSDIRRDKEQLLADIETVTQERFTARSELSTLKEEMEEASKKYQREMENLLQNLESMEHENKTLEDHLQKVRQNKMDLLEDLKVAEKDRLGLVKSLQALTMEKGGGEGGGKLFAVIDPCHSNMHSGYCQERVVCGNSKGYFLIFIHNILTELAINIYS